MELKTLHEDIIAAQGSIESLKNKFTSLEEIMEMIMARESQQTKALYPGQHKGEPQFVDGDRVLCWSNGVPSRGWVTSEAAIGFPRWKPKY